MVWSQFSLPDEDIFQLIRRANISRAPMHRLLLESIHMELRDRRALELNSQGIAFYNQFKRFGNVPDLERSIELLREAVASTPLHSAFRRGHLTNLGKLYICVVSKGLGTQRTLTRGLNSCAKQSCWHHWTVLTDQCTSTTLEWHIILVLNDLGKLRILTRPK